MSVRGLENLNRSGYAVSGPHWSSLSHILLIVTLIWRRKTINQSIEVFRWVQNLSICLDLASAYLSDVHLTWFMVYILVFLLLSSLSAKELGQVVFIVFSCIECNATNGLLQHQEEMIIRWKNNRTISQPSFRSLWRVAKDVCDWWNITPFQLTNYSRFWLMLIIKSLAHSEWFPSNPTKHTV